MKKILSLLLAACLTFSLTAVSFAVEKATPGVDFVGSAGKLVNYENFLNIDATGGTLVPGQVYYLECDWVNGPMTDEFFELYTSAVSVRSAYEKGDDRYLSSTSVASRINEAKFEKDGNGKYRLKFQAKTSFSYVEDLDLVIVATSKSKTNPDYRGWSEASVTVGYSQAGSSSGIITVSPLDVDTTNPIAEFDSALKECQLNFEDKSFYYANTSSKKGLKVNLLHTQEKNAVIAAANPTATLKFLNFVAKPSFPGDGVLKIYAPGTKYLYALDTTGALTLISDKNNNDFFGITTKELGNYVASSVALNTQVITPPTTTPPTTGTPVTPPPTHINPGTGANV